MGTCREPYFYLYHHHPHLYPLAALLTTASILINTLFFLLPVAVVKILSLTSFEICIYCIFVIINKCVVGWEKNRTKLKFVHVKIMKSVHIFIPTKTRAKLSDSGIRITWVHVSRLPTATSRQ